ncbi:hypothetical protein [Pseudaestuariivita atlantica]|nr:hypothetical protein [Pseudaestuariivita atlantica]
MTKFLSSLTFVATFALANAVFAQDAPVEALGEDELNSELAIAPLDCPLDTTDFTCIVEYLDRMGDSLGPSVEARLESLRENIDNAQNVEQQLTDMEQLALSIIDMSSEGGPLSSEMDRFGRLIIEFREEALGDIDTVDLAPLFEEEYARWEALRGRLGDLRVNANAAAAQLETAKKRAKTLLRANYVSRALDEIDASISGMENVVVALSTISQAAAGTESAEPNAASD